MGWRDLERTRRNSLDKPRDGTLQFATSAVERASLSALAVALCLADSGTGDVVGFV